MNSVKIPRHFIFVLLLIFLWSLNSYSMPRSKKTTRIEFGDELIRGETVNPDVFYLLKRRKSSFRKLIPLRNNFLPEMRRTSESITSGRSE